VDSLNFDDLYNNLKVFESDVKCSTASSSSIQNMAFVSENTSSTNDVSIAYGVSNYSGHNSQYEHTSSYSLLANQSSCSHDFHENEKVLQKDRSKGNQDSRRRDTWNTGNKDTENGRRSGKQEDSKALVTLDGEGVDWTKILDIIDIRIFLDNIALCTAIHLQYTLASKFVSITPV
ncbi:hypothetical protein Tco_1481395, partial [Tanacetum coccineum]